MLSEEEIDNLEITVPPSFNGFDKRAGAEIYFRNLPHWRQQGATYFVTFRTLDSIPDDVWSTMKEDVESWKVELASDPENPVLLGEYRIFRRRFQARVEKILGDSRGACLLRNPELRKEVISALHFYRSGNEDSKVQPLYELFGAVVMPNHVHLAIRPLGNNSLEDCLGRIKSWSARQINEKIQGKGSFWMEESFDHIIRDESNYVKTIRYILKNPVKAGLREDEYYLYSLDL